MVKRIARLGALLAVLALTLPVSPAVAGGGGGCHRQEATSARTVRIVLESNCFMPTMARVAVGGTVSWINHDPYSHTVTGASNAWGSFQELVTNATSKMRFARAGVYPYFCALHPGMVGAVLVGDANGPGSATIVAGGSVVEEVDGEQAKPVAAKQPVSKSSGPWPVVAMAVGAAAGLAGFGYGRRARSSIHP